MTNSPIAPRCCAPWQTMLIDATGAVHPCAYRGNYNNPSGRPSCGNVNESSLAEIWNGDEYQLLRENMAKGDLEAAGCANCLALKQGQPLQLQRDADADREQPPTTAYAKNMQQKREEIAAGATFLQSQPTVVYYTPTHKCNLRCIHCYQDYSRHLTLTNRDADREVLELLPVLDQIVAGGGEPLLLPIWKQFISKADLHVNPYLEFATTTNATVLSDEMLEGLKRFKRLALTVSLDGGTKEVFEAIRLRGHFEQVVANVEKLIRLTEEHPRAAMSVTFSVMKANLLDLPNLVRFCAERGTGYNLLPVLCYPVDQSLRSFNDPQTQMRGWDDSLTEASRMLDELLVATGRLAPSIAALYHGHFSALRENIPWELLLQSHVRVRSTVPQHLLNCYVPGKLDQRLQVGLFPIENGTWRECRYYAELGAEREFEVHLPDGEFLGTIFPRNAVPVPDERWRIEVREGRCRTISEPMTGSDASHWLGRRGRDALRAIRLPNALRGLRRTVQTLWRKSA